ncbi:MAG: ligase-associated DNA damage response endonuclease PdeM [Elainellaceae cyanobacterium]
MNLTQTELAAAHRLELDGTYLHLLPEKAIYVESLACLLVSDVHLGKAETFQAFGIPIPSATNRDSLSRLQTLCDRLNPKTLVILGDLFHAKEGLTSSVVKAWVDFVNAVSADIHLIVGNHDRSLLSDLDQLLIQCHWQGLSMGSLWLTHDPVPLPPDQGHTLNICGHIHPCLRLTTKLDDIRLPCFYLDNRQRQLTLPSFGAFTGGHNVSLHQDSVAYGIVDNTITPFTGKAKRQSDSEVS